MVVDFVVVVELWVFIVEGVEVVWVGCDDLFDVVVVECVDVVLSYYFEYEFVVDVVCRVIGVVFFVIEDGEFDVCFFE